MKTNFLATLALLTLLLATTTAVAQPIVSGDLLHLATAPASVDIGDLESNTNSFFFLEQTSVILPNDFPVNIVSPGSYNGLPLTAVNLLPGGTLVDSYFVHFDPVGSPTGSDPASFSEGGISFGQDVVAIITQDGLLDNSESLGFGATGTLYPTSASAPGRGVDSPDADTIQLSPDRRTVSFLLAARSPGDQMRILVASPIPEPNTLVLFAVMVVTSMLGRHRS